jgi:hypothetical protein
LLVVVFFGGGPRFHNQEQKRVTDGEACGASV